MLHPITCAHGFLSNDQVIPCDVDIFWKVYGEKVRSHSMNECMVEHAVTIGACVQCYTQVIDLESRNCYFLIMCLIAHERYITLNLAGYMINWFLL